MTDEAAYQYDSTTVLFGATLQGVIRGYGAKLDSAQEAYSQLHNFNIQHCWSLLLEEWFEPSQIS